MCDVGGVRVGRAGVGGHRDVVAVHAVGAWLRVDFYLHVREGMLRGRLAVVSIAILCKSVGPKDCESPVAYKRMRMPGGRHRRVHASGPECIHASLS